MSRCLAALLLLCLSWVLPAAPGRAQSQAGMLCQAAIAAAERGSGVPDQLLDAISRVESGRYDAAAGTVRGWPWTINAEGRGHFYASKDEAVAAARAFQAAGIRSIDVGCLQINLMFHPDGFASLEEAFDPSSNARYAARFLTDLFHQTGSWPHAAAAYHSQTPDLGSDYQRKVLEAWADPIDRPSDAANHHRALPASHVGSLFAAASPGPAASLSPAAFTSMNRPLGGFGHVIRTAGTAATAGLPQTTGQTTGRDLAAYRAMPVRVAFLAPRALRE